MEEKTHHSRTKQSAHGPDLETTDLAAETTGARRALEANSVREYRSLGDPMFEEHRNNTAKLK